MREDVFETHSYEETYELARKLGEESEAGAVYALDGDLGAGPGGADRGLPAV